VYDSFSTVVNISLPFVHTYKSFGTMATPLEYWLSADGISLLERAQSLLGEYSGDTLAAGTALRKQTLCLPGQATDALSFTLLREKAVAYGVWTAQGFFTRQSLEQATAPLIAQHHAKRFHGCKHVLEICTGAGFDTAALSKIVSEVGGHITSIEADEHLAAMARQNLAAQRITNVEVICSRAEDIVEQLDHMTFDGLWADPSRRNARGQRIANPNEYAPSLDWLMNLSVRGVRGIKLAPALNCSEFFEAAVLAKWQREWIGTPNECREQTLWSGIHGMVDNSAILLENDGTVHQWRPTEKSGTKLRLDNTDNNFTTTIEHLAGAYLVEPHRCIIRTGALDEFFAEQGITIPDSHIAYGIARDEPNQSMWYDVFRILEAFPFHFVRLKERIAMRQWGNGTEIKKRGFPESPDELRRKLKLPSRKESGVLVLTRFGAQHVVMLAERVCRGDFTEAGRR
jgi:hypothetical protein